MNTFEVELADEIKKDAFNNVDDLIKLITTTEKGRLLILFNLMEKLPMIAAHYQSKLKQDKTDALFNEKLVVLQNLVRQDFLKTKNPDWIELFLQNSISPLSLKRIEEIMKVKSDLPSLEAVPGVEYLDKFTQRTQNRTQLHTQCFFAQPNTSISASCYRLYPDRGNPFHVRMQHILKTLMSNNVVIAKQIHHWTYLNNLQSILWEGKIYGHKQLADIKNIYFQKNGLNYDDISNGDEDVICFAPYLVEPQALFDVTDRKLKNHLVRLTVDITKSAYRWELQQFFKLYDFGLNNVRYTVKIDDKLSFNFERNSNLGNDLKVTIKLNKDTIQHIIKKKESVFYGDHYAINQFCLDQLPKILNRIDHGFLTKFNAYLSTLTDNEIKKIFVTFAQSLTICCEYNINHSLKLTNNMMTHIYLADENLLFDLESLSEHEYAAACESIKQTGVVPLTPVQMQAPIIEHRSDNAIKLYGTIINYSSRQFYLDYDASTIDPDLFGQGYYETRPGLQQASTIELDNSLRF